MIKTNTGFITSSSIRSRINAHPVNGGYTLPRLSRQDYAQRTLATRMLSGVSLARSFFDTFPRITRGSESLLTFLSEKCPPLTISGPNMRSQNTYSGQEYFIKNNHIGTSTTGKTFHFSEFTPRSSDTNGKCVVLFSGLGMSVEAYYRIGESTEETQDSIMKRLINMGYRVIIVDFPEIGKNSSYFSTRNSFEAMRDEIIPAFLDFLDRNRQLHENGLYFMAHSMGGLMLYSYFETLREKPEELKKFSPLLKNILTLAAPELPIPDVSPMFPALMAANPVLAKMAPNVGYKSLGAFANKLIPGSLLVGGDLSLAAYRMDFPPSLLAEMFAYATKNFSFDLAFFLINSFWIGRFPFINYEDLFTLPGQRQIRIIGHNDPISTVEGLYFRLSAEKAREKSALLRITQDGDGVYEAIRASRSLPVTGIAIDNIKHLEISCVNKYFDMAVWPIVLSFLQEPLEHKG